ncbi:MAG: hypothetical protein GY782_05365 [Gammaproteobacteria bacterium]|nr:hypothetical protein [Gammaproteobacteria bacterium]
MTTVAHVLPQFKHSVPRCTAKSKRTGNLCRQPAMKNGKCRFHGGKSTSAKTVEGKRRRDTARLTHGYYSKESKEERRQMRTALNMMCDAL